MNAGTRQPHTATAIDRFILGFGHILSWANLLLILVIVVQVALRYGFGKGMVALEELEWHLYSLAFMFGLAYALVTDAHVRVDLLSSRMRPVTRAWVEMVGIVVLVLPFVVAIVVYGWEFFLSSWARNERSLAPMGLAYRWAIKAVIPLSFILLGLAALTRLVRTFQQIKRPTDAA